MKKLEEVLQQVIETRDYLQEEVSNYKSKAEEISKECDECKAEVRVLRLHKAKHDEMAEEVRSHEQS